MAKKNINDASADDLMNAVPGMGEKAARDIIKHRDKKGPVNDMNVFKSVKGVDNSVVEELKRHYEAKT